MPSRHQQQVLVEAKARVEQRSGQFPFARALRHDDPMDGEVARPRIALREVNR